MSDLMPDGSVNPETANFAPEDVSEMVVLVYTAEPTEQRLHRTLGGCRVVYSSCVWCHDLIWKGPGWDWEHVDSDEEECRLGEW